MEKLNIDKIINLCKTKGFIYPGSEIYGGLGNTWDYGPLGIEIKNNIKKEWWRQFIQCSENSYGLDAGILMNPRVWEASGHIQSFTDPLMDCKNCKTRHRADNLVQDYAQKHNININADGMSLEQLDEFVTEHKICCPNCGNHNFTSIRKFNLMFETYRGVTKDNQNIIYLRPETAQGAYVDFLNIQRSMRTKIPFGIAQIGKAFRNEITPGNFTFRTIEFEQMEHQWFCKQGSDEKYYDYYKQKGMDFISSLGIKKENLRYKDHEKLAHYAKNACDIEYLFPFGWGEVNGTHNRTNYDLKRHQEFSGKCQDYLDPVTNEKFIPYVVESTYGVERLILALLCDSFDTETLEDGTTRDILHLSPKMAAYKVAVLPLIKKEHNDKALDVYKKLCCYFPCTFDDAGSIGKRYRRQDEIGTPYCVTVDFDTLNDDTVTIRDRDSMEQIRIHINDLPKYVLDKLI